MSLSSRFPNYCVLVPACLFIFNGFGRLEAAGLDRNGIGAASMGTAGASVARPKDPLQRLTQNPASLSELTGFEFQLGGTLAYAEGDFSQKGQYRGRLTDTWGVLPDVAATLPLGEKAGIGLSLTTDTTRLANWQITDVPGALADARYAQRTHRSEILNLRAALGLGVELGGGFSIGASVGGVYTRNELRSPYTFQNNQLAGAKTWLDLESDGFGVNGDLGLQWKVSKNLTLGLSYRTPTSFSTSGEAHGDAGRQAQALGVRGADGRFRYDADVDTELPQKVAAGFNASLTEHWRLMGQVDWVNWSAAYSDLNVRLSNGSNALVNQLAGSSSLRDTTALDWEDQFVFRLGSEWDLTEALVLRLGYAYGKSPVPGSTLLPMTAAISEHTLACGLGWQVGRMTIDLGYQYDLPISRSAPADKITGPEFRDSEVSLEAHWVGLTMGIKL